MEGFNGGAGHAAGGAVLLTALMSRQITKALASHETDRARLPPSRLLKNVYTPLLYSSSIDGLCHGAKLEIKKKVVRIESARELCVMYMAINKVLHDTYMIHGAGVLSIINTILLELI